MKKHVKRSLSTHFTIVFILTLMVIIFFCMLLNSTMIERFYRNSKKNAVVKCYTQVNDLFNNEEIPFNTEEFDNEFSRITTNENVSITVVNSSLNIVKTSVPANNKMIQRLVSYILKNDPNYLFEENSGGDIIFEATDTYEIRMTHDPRMRNDFIELIGTMDNGDIVYIRSAMEGIRSNIRLSNRFLLFISIMAALFGGILILFVSKQITKPILKLAELSERMTNLDFDAKYEGHDDNEIGYLGERMNKMSSTLESTITELKNANNELKDDLEKREHLDAMRSDFISNVSHELKTPISIIQGYAEGLKDDISDDPESREYYCDVIIDEAAKMNRMVKDLLTLNQLEFGNDAINLERFDILEMIRNYISNASILAEDTKVNLSFENEEQLYVWGDEYKIEEVVMNYFTNAVHHVRKGGEITIKTEKTADGHVRVSVLNSGDSISEEDLSQIWVKFYKADKSRSRQYGGSGIGLSIVKAIMEAHHQRYGVINHDGSVEFYFELDPA